MSACANDGLWTEWSDEFNGLAELEQYTVRLENVRGSKENIELTARLEPFTFGADGKHDL
jgi:hypothetical protein